MFGLLNENTIIRAHNLFVTVTQYCITNICGWEWGREIEYKRKPDFILVISLEKTINNYCWTDTKAKWHIKFENKMVLTAVLMRHENLLWTVFCFLQKIEL